MDVTTGVRPRERSEGGYRFDWSASVIPPHSTAHVKDVEVPPVMFREVHESVAQRAFKFWVRFKDERGSWEVTRDAGTDQHEFRSDPPPLDRTSLNARVLHVGEGRYRLLIENDGDTPVEQVECLFSDDVQNWSLLTEELQTYPIPVLEPGDEQRIRLHVWLGGPSMTEATVRGLANGVPYERKRTLSVI